MSEQTAGPGETPPDTGDTVYDVHPDDVDEGMGDPTERAQVEKGVEADTSGEAVGDDDDELPESLFEDANRDEPAKQAEKQTDERG